MRNRAGDACATSILKAICSRVRARQSAIGNGVTQKSVARLLEDPLSFGVLPLLDLVAKRDKNAA